MWFWRYVNGQTDKHADHNVQSIGNKTEAQSMNHTDGMHFTVHLDT